jgi:hypothetical protein
VNSFSRAGKLLLLVKARQAANLATGDLAASFYSSAIVPLPPNNPNMQKKASFGNRPSKRFR